jgi:hypothetical protein
MFGVGAVADKTAGRVSGPAFVKVAVPVHAAVGIGISDLTTPYAGVVAA